MLDLNSIVSVIVNAGSASSGAGSFSAGLILAPETGDTAAPGSSDSGSSGSDAAGSGASASGDSAADQRLRRYFSLDAMTEDGFSPSDPAFLAAKAYFSADPAPDRVFVSLYPASETLPEALDAALAAPLNADLEEEAGFYALYVCETDGDRLLALAEDLDARPVPFVLCCGMTGDPAEAAAPGSFFHSLRRLSTSRVMGLFGADIYAPAALMGTAMGLARSQADSSFALCYKTLPGSVPVDLTESAVKALKALNANVYITRGRRNLLENGTIFSGLRFDEVQTLDRISSALREAAVELLTGRTGKLPQTDETSALFINRFTAVLSGFTARGLLASAPWRGAAVGSLEPGDTVENGFRLWADPYDEQSDEDRQAHKAMPIHAALCLTGSVESLVIQIDVTV